jgi:hypothetical protein
MIIEFWENFSEPRRGVIGLMNYVIPSGFGVRFYFDLESLHPSGLSALFFFYILKTPKLFSSTGEFNTTDNANPKT